MGMILFILGMVFLIGGLAFGLPLHWRDALGMGGMLGIIIPTAVLGLAGIITGLVMLYILYRNRRRYLRSRRHPLNLR